MSVFKFKEFDVIQENCAQKVGTDAMVLGALVDHEFPKNILDIGTGTGVIALMLAQKYSDAHVEGVEISKECADTAKMNFINSPYKERLELIHTDFNTFTSDKTYDLIVSNPPFFKNSTHSPYLERTNSRHESTLKLENIISRAYELMNKNATLWIIIPNERSKEVEFIAKQNNLELTKQIKIFGVELKQVREILVLKKIHSSTEVIKSNFTIRNVDGTYTDQYKSKTKEFHFKTL